MVDSKTLAQTFVKLMKTENSEKSISKFFDYLKKKNLLGLLPQVKKHILRQEKLASAENTLSISSKHDLSESEIKDIVSLVGADKTVSVEVIKDEAVIGGFSAIYAGNIYDGSVRNQMTQLGKRLTQK